MATTMNIFGIFFAFVAVINTVSAIQCRRCVYIKEHGVEETDENAVAGHVYGDEACLEFDKEESETPDGDQCTGDSELPAVAAYKPEEGWVNWNDVVKSELDIVINGTDHFGCQKIEITLTSTASEKKLDVFERSCAYKVKDECKDPEGIVALKLYKDIYAELYKVEVATVSAEGEVCQCKDDYCNSAPSALASLGLLLVSMVLARLL